MAPSSAASSDGEAPAAPRRYKKLPVVWGIPQDVQAQAAHALSWLAAEMAPAWDLAGVEVAWYADAGPLDWPDDAGVFETDRPAWGAVDPAAPRVVLLHQDNRWRARRAFVRTVLHEGCHVAQFARGLQHRRTMPELEAMVDEYLGVAFADVLAGVPQGRMG